MKGVYKAKIYIAEDGYFHAEFWEIHERIEFNDEWYVLDDKLDEDNEYVYRKEQ